MFGEIPNLLYIIIAAINPRVGRSLFHPSEEIKCAYLLLGLISSTFFSKFCAPRMVFDDGGETVDELCKKSIRCGKCLSNHSS